MQPDEVTELHYLLSSGTSPYPCFSGISHNNITQFQMNRYSNLLANLHQISPQLQDLNPQASCFSSNSTSDEADEQQLSIINERKQRRMISNRESARRSRMRKQRHLDELWSLVVWLRNENHQLVDKLNHATDCHDRVVQENVQLKERVSELLQMLTDLQMKSPYSLRDLEDVSNADYLENDSSI
ncbi:Basic leucine zipper 43 [Ancistrocladus abbreviatus]